MIDIASLPIYFSQTVNVTARNLKGLGLFAQKIMYQKEKRWSKPLLAAPSRFIAPHNTTVLTINTVRPMMVLP